MAGLKTLGSMEFIYLAEVAGREWKYARLYLPCEACFSRGLAGCESCGGTGHTTVAMPILIHQQMPTEDFEKLREAMRKADAY